MSDRHLTRTAVFVFLEKDGKIFLLRRANTGWSDGLLTVPAGHVDKGQSVTEAAIVEVKEEAGVEIAAKDLEFIHVDFVRDEYANFYFRVRHWQGEPTNSELHRANEALWADVDHLPDDCLPQIKRVVEHQQTGVYFSDIERSDT